MFTPIKAKETQNKNTFFFLFFGFGLHEGKYLNLELLKTILINQAQAGNTNTV